MCLGNSWQLSGLYTYLPQVIKCLSRFCVAVCDCISADLLLLDNCYQDLGKGSLKNITYIYLVADLNFQALCLLATTCLKRTHMNTYELDNKYLILLN